MTALHLDPLVLLGVALAAVAYGRGMRAVPVERWRAVSFFAGLVTILVALVSPLATLAEELFLAHMVQHLLLVMAAVPLVLLGAPAVPLLRGIPREMRAAYVVPLARSGALRALWGLVTNPLVALGAYVAVLSAWHLPPLYDAALADPAVHAFEHLSFLAVAFLFWSQIIDPYPFRSVLSYPVRILALFIATAHGTALGGILSFTESPLYRYYAALAPRPFGLPADVDQQAGGVIMWVPGGMMYLLAISIVFAVWLQAEDRAGDGPRSEVSSRPLHEHV